MPAPTTPFVIRNEFSAEEMRRPGDIPVPASVGGPVPDARGSANLSAPPPNIPQNPLAPHAADVAPTNLNPLQNPITNPFAPMSLMRRASGGAGAIAQRTVEEKRGPGGIDPGLVGGPPQGQSGGGGMPIIQTGGSGGGAPQERDRLSPTQRRLLEEQRTAEEEYAHYGGDKAKQDAMAESAAYYDHERKIEAQMQAGAVREAERQRDLAERQKEFDAASKELSQVEYDPQGFFHSKSAIGQAGVIAGILLGGLGGAMNRTHENKAMATYQKLEDDNFAAQRAQHGAMKDALGAKSNAYQQAMMRFGDERAAESAWRAAHKEAFLATAQRLAAQSRSTQVENQYKQLEIDIMGKRTQDAMQFLQYGATGGGQAPSKLPDLDPTRDYQMPDGSWVRAPTAEHRKELDERVQSLDRVEQSVARIEQLRGALGYKGGGIGTAIRDKFTMSPGGEFFDRDRRAMQDQLTAESERLALSMKGAGMNSDKDQATLKSLQGNVRGTGPGATRALQDRVADARANVGRQVQSGFYQPLQPVQLVDPKTGLPQTKVIPGFGQSQGPQQTQRPPSTPFNAPGKR